MSPGITIPKPLRKGERGISSVEWSTQLGESPAKCFRSTGRVLLNLALFPRLHPDVQYFILCHELAHIALQTKDEKRCDRYARALYTRSGRSIKRGLEAIGGVLPFTTAEHYEREEEQIKDLLDHDRRENGNELATFNNVQKLTAMCNVETLSPEQLADASSILGLGKDAKEYRKQKRAVKLEKKKAKVAKKNAKAAAIENRSEAKLTKAEAKNILAQQGIQDTSLVEQMITGGGGPEVTEDYPEEDTILGMSKKAFTWVVVAVVAVAAIVGAVLYFRKGKG